jgi:uncharacterized membrane protein YhfC
METLLGAIIFSAALGAFYWLFRKQDFSWSGLALSVIVFVVVTMLLRTFT